MGWEATQSVIERLVARLVEGERGLVHVQWLAGAQGQRVVQVYVDGRLSEVAGDAQVRELWVMADAARAHRVDVLAVPAAEAWKDHAGLLAAEGETHVGWQPGVIRDLRLPVDTRMQVRAGGGSGA
ncbi:MAG: hypothetical protein HC898_04890 [Phycisphaerales bacterium]|nr:hypothetical protein [Phycisphaerales bacterium]